MDKKTYIGEKNFWNKWFSKLLFTLISVKVWGLLAGTWVSTWLLINTNSSGEHYITSAQWLTFNTTIWALIFGMKEIFRISEKKDAFEQENLKKHMEQKVEVTRILSETRKADPVPNKSEFEIMGDEPC
jgi:hypothetical protein